MAKGKKGRKCRVPYLPTQKEIAEEARKIREDWPYQRRIKQEGSPPVHWNVPICHIEVEVDDEGFLVLLDY